MSSKSRPVESDIDSGSSVRPAAAEILQTSERTVRRLIASGQLRAHRLRRLVRIADVDIAALLDATRII